MKRFAIFYCLPLLFFSCYNDVEEKPSEPDGVVIAGLSNLIEVKRARGGRVNDENVTHRIKYELYTTVDQYAVDRRTIEGVGYDIQDTVILGNLDDTKQYQISATVEFDDPEEGYQMYWGSTPIQLNKGTIFIFLEPQYCRIKAVVKEGTVIPEQVESLWYSLYPVDAKALSFDFRKGEWKWDGQFLEYGFEWVFDNDGSRETRWMSIPAAYTIESVLVTFHPGEIQTLLDFNLELDPQGTYYLETDYEAMFVETANLNLTYNKWEDPTVLTVN